MRMPEFTADIALSRSDKRYWLAGAHSPLASGGTVIPAAPPAFSADCALLGCITVCEEHDYGVTCTCQCPEYIPPYSLKTPLTPF
jgi:hypothetical protein